VGGGVQTGSTRHVGHLLAYCTCPGWLWGWRICWNEWQGKPRYSEKTCPGATLSTTNPTWPYPELNPARRGGKPATNRFSYGAANCSRVRELSFRIGGHTIEPYSSWHKHVTVQLPLLFSPFSCDGLGPLAYSFFRINFKTMNLTDRW
jgi:hypothetical protein